MSEQQIKQEYLRKIGMNIGEECFIFSDKDKKRIMDVVDLMK